MQASLRRRGRVRVDWRLVGGCAGLVAAALWAAACGGRLEHADDAGLKAGAATGGGSPTGESAAEPAGSGGGRDALMPGDESTTIPPAEGLPDDRESWPCHPSIWALEDKVARIFDGAVEECRGYDPDSEPDNGPPYCWSSPVLIWDVQLLVDAAGNVTEIALALVGRPDLESECAEPVPRYPEDPSLVEGSWPCLAGHRVYFRCWEDTHW